MDYNLQANRKSKEGTDHPDRDAPNRTRYYLQILSRHRHSAAVVVLAVVASVGLLREAFMRAASARQSSLPSPAYQS